MSEPPPLRRARSSRARCQAVESPWIPAPTTTYGALRGTATTVQNRRIDTFAAIASKRDWRKFADRPVPDDVERRILDAGRLAGSASNRQPWRFLVVDDAGLRERVAETVYASSNVLGAALVVAVVGRPGEMPAFDAGRAVQNMFLAAWNEGVVSVPNGMPDRDRAAEVLGVECDEVVRIVLAFGYPARPADPERRSAEEWSAQANRRPLDEVVERR